MSFYSRCAGAPLCLICAQWGLSGFRRNQTFTQILNFFSFYPRTTWFFQVYVSTKASATWTKTLSSSSARALNTNTTVFIPKSSAHIGKFWEEANPSRKSQEMKSPFSQHFVIYLLVASFTNSCLYSQISDRFSLSPCRFNSTLPWCFSFTYPNKNTRFCIRFLWAFHQIQIRTIHGLTQDVPLISFPHVN